MGNGSLSQEQFLAMISSDVKHLVKSVDKLWLKFDEHREGNCSTQRELTEHKNKDHRLMWTMIIGLPTLIGIIVTLIKLLGE